MSQDVDGSIASPLLSGLAIDVTGEDIEAGEGGNCWRCPVAIAINRMLPDYRAWVVADFVELVPREGGTGIKIDTPWEVGEFARNFDELREYEDCETDEDFEAFRDNHGIDADDEIEPEGVEPFSFVLRLSR